MAAEELKLVRDDEVKRYVGIGGLSGHETNLNVPATWPQALDRAAGRHRSAESVNGAMRPTSGELPDAGRHVRGGSVHGVDCTEGYCEFKFCPVNIDCDWTSPEGVSDHDCGNTHAAATVNGYPIAWSNPGLLDNGPVGGRQPATQDCRGDEVKLVGQANKILVCILQHDEIRERSPGREARLELAGAHLLVAGLTERALSASTHKGGSNPVASLPLVDLPADSFDDS